MSMTIPWLFGTKYGIFAPALDTESEIRDEEGNSEVLFSVQLQ